ncbi:hypothetical protein EXT69_14735 [Pantoea agglomerans]|jgi:hypothetical protein|uniref:hypothetical protein n=1 Tax=Enterobacter agglomerans TaxID=549 RepID=UPI00202D6A76|nr:hypothetical protein [Pantoea agglomerans]MCL6412190.1 hypothetical protein [Pantoea agglomerans]
MENTNFILLDERWELDDLSILSKDYMQLYGMFYLLEHDIEYIAGEMPWQGGHSVVHFFRNMYYSVPHQYRPKIIKMKYASPGFIELALDCASSNGIAYLISAVSGFYWPLAKLYKLIMAEYTKNKWAKKKENGSDTIPVTDEDIEKARFFNNELINLMEIDDKHNYKIDMLSNYDELVKLKILLAMYRRALPLVELSNEGKADFITSDIADELIESDARFKE